MHVSIISLAISLSRCSRCDRNSGSGQCRSRMKHCSASSFQNSSSLVEQPLLRSLITYKSLCCVSVSVAKHRPTLRIVRSDPAPSTSIVFPRPSPGCCSILLKVYRHWVRSLDAAREVCSPVRHQFCKLNLSLAILRPHPPTSTIR